MENNMDNLYAQPNHDYRKKNLPETIINAIDREFEKALNLAKDKLKDLPDVLRGGTMAKAAEMLNNKDTIETIKSNPEIQAFIMEKYVNGEEGNEVAKSNEFAEIIKEIATQLQ